MVTNETFDSIDSRLSSQENEIVFLKLWVRELKVDVGYLTLRLIESHTPVRFYGIVPSLVYRRLVNDEMDINIKIAKSGSRAAKEAKQVAAEVTRKALKTSNFETRDVSDDDALALRMEYLHFCDMLLDKRGPHDHAADSAAG